VAPTYHHALPVGTKIQNYEIQSVLGIGGFGITYKAYDSTLERVVAIKEYLPTGLAVRVGDGTTVIPKSEGDAQDYHYGLKRFLDEARTLARFHERSIVRVIAYMEAHGTAYFVMDYEEGDCLDTRLKAVVTLPQDEIVRVLLPIVQGLRAVHAQNFLHRDIKPLNIYVRRDGSPVLLDFGAAREALGAQSRVVTRMVTPGYAPFEQYLANTKQGPWSDIYAIGATMYHCAIGVAPMAATERVAAVHDKEPDPVRKIADTLKSKFAPEFVDVLMWMLEPMAKDRPQTVDEVLPALEACLGGRQPAAPAPTGRRRIVRSTGADEDEVDLTAPAVTLPPETLHAIEVNLAQHIGPMSKVLVQKAAARAADVGALTELLSRFIDSDAARTSFLASTRALSSSEVLGRNPPASVPPAPAAPGTGARAARPAVDAALIEAAERELAGYLGPMARILVKRAASGAEDARDFCERLAQELHDPDKRDAFVRALTRH
jgi:serine/threonine protein kinase